MEELVSVVMPTFNGSNFIKRALDSIVNQTYKNIEIIVVDDLSTDNTYEYVKSLKYTNLKLYKSDKKVTASYARNIGISKAKGKYIAFMDDDEEWNNLKVYRQVEFLRNNPSYKAVLTNHFYKAGESIKAVNSYSSDYTKDILLMNVQVSAGSNILAYKSVVDKIGRFDENFVGHQDLEFAIRLDQECKIGHIDGYLFTVHGRSQRNASNTEKLIKAKSMYLTKFKDLIDSYPKNIASRIYARHWLQVSRAFFLNGDNKNGFEYLKKSYNYKFLFSHVWKIIPHETYFFIILTYAKNLFIR